MARTSYEKVLALPDAAQTWNFDLFFPLIPGSGDAAQLTYKCKGTSIPSSKIEQILIELHGTQKAEAGRAVYDHSFTATFMETVDYGTYLKFRAWRDKIRSWKRNTGSNSSAYKVNVELDVYDNAGEVAQTFILAGSFVTDINEVQLNGAENQAVEMSITLSFDYVDDGISF